MNSPIPLNIGYKYILVTIFTVFLFIVSGIVDFYLPLLLVFLVSGFIVILSYHNFDLDEYHLLYVYLFVTFFIPLFEISSAMPKVRPEQLIAFTAFPALLLLSKRESYPQLAFFIKFFIIFQLLQIISTLYGILELGVTSGFKDIVEIIRVAQYGLLAYTIGHFTIDKNRLYEVIYIIIAFFALCSLIGFFQYFGILGLDRITAPLYFEGSIHDVHVRMMGTFVNPNTFGTFMTFGTLIATGMFLYETKTSRRALLLLTIVLLFTTVVLTLSRTAFVAVAMGMLSLIPLYSYIRGYNFFNFLVIFAALLVLIIVILFVMRDSLARYKTLLTFMEDKSWQMRLAAWYINLKVFLHSPYLGWGIGFHQFSSTVDSEYILVLRRYGIIGFLAYLHFYILPFIHAFKSLKGYSLQSVFNVIFLSCIIAFVISNIANPLFHSMQLMNFWSAFLGLAYAVNRSKFS